MFLTFLLSSFLTFVELNCENLFDTLHDSLKNDWEFTPESTYHWTRTRYWRKINYLAQEIVALGDLHADSTRQIGQVPDLIALCEVENDSVMRDLTKRSLLRHAGYEYLMTASPDERGIDVALMYIPSSFCPLRSYPIRIALLPQMKPTRDILYTCGQIAGGDSLHIFVVHAPSRRGGELASRPYRLQVVRQLTQAVDSIRSLCASAHIVVAGDFNDYSDSPSLRSLCADGRLVEVSADAHGQHGAKATYRWHGEWRSLDHILCSEPWARRVKSCLIGDLPFLLVEDEKYGGVKPFRTYFGPKYLGGYSDHLPLVVRFEVNE